MLPPASDATARQQAAPARPARRLPLIVTLAVLVALTARTAVLVVRSAVDLPYMDQWDFYRPLFAQASWWRTFAWQHGPHREGIGLVLDRLVLGATHWSAAAEALLVVLALAAAALVALRLKALLFGQLDYTDVVIPCFFLSTAQVPLYLSAPNPSYSALPELLILLYCLAGMLRRPLARYAALLALNFVLIYTGFGFFMGVVTLGLFALDAVRAQRAGEARALPVAALGLAAASLASFFVRYQWNPAVSCFVFPDPQPWRYPWFVSLMFGYFVGLKRPLAAATIVGGALLVFALAVGIGRLARLCRQPRWMPLDRTLVTLLGFTLIYASNTALGRVCLGLPDAAAKGNYMGLLVPALLGLYFFLLALRPGARRTIALAVFLVVLMPNTLKHRPNRVELAQKRAWKSCYLESGDLDGCNRATGFSPYPPEAIAAYGLKDKLDYLERNRLSLFRRR
jgi:hypothetical protein